MTENTPQDLEQNTTTAQPQTDKKDGGWFNRMKTGLSKSRKNLADGMVNILIGGKERSWRFDLFTFVI